MNITGNIGLKKPEQQDFYDIDDFNYNADIIDAKMAVLSELTGLAGGIKNIRIFTSSGTFGTEAGKTYKIIAIGGGGGGQITGGLSGEVVFDIYTPTANKNVTITVGAGGQAGTATAGASNGGTSSFGITVTADGGLSGNATNRSDSSYIGVHNGDKGFFIGPRGAYDTLNGFRRPSGYGSGGYGFIMQSDSSKVYTSAGAGGAVIIMW